MTLPPPKLNIDQRNPRTLRPVRLGAAADSLLSAVLASRQVLRRSVSSATSTPGYSPRAKLDHSIARPHIDVSAVRNATTTFVGTLKYRQRY